MQICHAAAVQERGNVTIEIIWATLSIVPNKESTQSQLKDPNDYMLVSAIFIVGTLVIMYLTFKKTLLMFVIKEHDVYMFTTYLKYTHFKFSDIKKFEYPIVGQSLGREYTYGVITLTNGKEIKTEFPGYMRHEKLVDILHQAAQI